MAVFLGDRAKRFQTEIAEKGIGLYYYKIFLSIHGIPLLIHTEGINGDYLIVPPSEADVCCINRAIVAVC